MNLVTDLAHKAHELAGRKLPSDVAGTAEEHLVDTVGAILAGYGSLHERVELLSERVGFAGAARATPAAIRRAAFAGGAYAHAWEVDDIFREAVICPGSVMLPALLSVLDLRPNADWEEFVRCYAIGYEIALAAGLAVSSNALISAGWWPTALIGPLGGAAAVSVFLNCTLDETASAIALAAQQAGGVIAGSVATSDSRYLLSALAAERSVTAVLTAGAGWNGPRDILDNSRSPFPRTEREHAQPSAYLLPLTSIKPHAGPKHLQAAIDVVVELRSRPDWDVREIVSMTCHLPVQLVAIVDRPAPFESTLMALASAQFILASTALHGRSTPFEFGRAALDDQRLVALAQAVTVISDEGLSAAYPHRWGARVDVKTRSGTLTEQRSDARGDPSFELSREELVAKFAALAGPVLTSSAAAELATGLFEAGTDRPLSLLRERVLPLLQPSSNDS